MELTVGQEVVWNCIEGFGGNAVVVGVRVSNDCQYQVQMLDGANHYQRNWAFDSELTLPEDPKTRDDVIRSTARHIRRVGWLLTDVAADLSKRAVNHDASKWSPEEWPAFEMATPKLATLTYGSEEYKASLKAIKPAIRHHNQVNRHHPEHHKGGVNDMTLLDLMEMLCDWKAATERHHDGSIVKSFEHNKDRFGISPQLLTILQNTARGLGWIK